MNALAHTFVQPLLGDIAAQLTAQAIAIVSEAKGVPSLPQRSHADHESIRSHVAVPRAHKTSVVSAARESSLITVNCAKDSDNKAALVYLSKLC